MNNIILNKTYFIEVNIPAGSTATQFLFPQIGYLDDTIADGISSYLVDILPLSPSGKPLANSALLASSYVTLVVGSENFISNIPLLDLVTLNSPVATGQPNNQFRTNLADMPIIWNKCYIQVANPALISAVQNEVFVFNVSYKNRRK